MTPEELRKIALDSSKQEYESIYKEMEKAAKEGSFSCRFSHLSDGTIEHLRTSGFSVRKGTSMANALSPREYIEVSFKK